MKRFSTFLAVLLCTAAAIFADGPFRNHRYDSFKTLNVTSDNILFIGNSITDMHCWPEVFVTSNGDYLPIVNRGNSGTYSTEQSDNLESYINGKPKKVFMMIGTNDIATSGGLNFSPEQVLAYVKSIVTRIHARSPQTKVYLYSILKNNTSNRVEATWLKTNEIVKAYADATDKVTYVDLYDKLTDVANGGAWSYDKLHLTAGAYQVWASTICEYLAEGEDYTVSCAYPENTLALQNRGGLSNASHGMRATYFSCLPISANDVLVFGDSFVKNGEWQEFLGNRNVKNRGTGWGNSGDISTTSGIVDATFATIEGVSKVAPKAMFLYTGTGDCTGSTDIATVKANYKALVDKLAEKASNAKIYLMAICPRNNAGHNTRIAELNAYMESIATGNIRFVDTYTPFINDGTVNSKYVFSNDYIGGLAYIKIANLMKTALLADFPGDTYNVTSEADAETRYAQAGLRNQLTQVIARGLVATRGNEAGQYNATAMAAFDEKLAEASTLLEKSNITQDEVTEMANALNTILNGALSMPTNSTQGNEVWYQLSTPNRNNKYLTSTGAGSGVVGADKNNYATSMWKFVARLDGSLDIINRNDNSYLAPTAAYNAQISTSATQPAAGWTLSYANTPGLFIISSGTVQLNQTTLTNTPVYNWSNGQTGTDRGDTGCQYMIEAVEGEPDELPDPSVQTLTLTPTEFQKADGKSTWTYHGNTSSGGWYGKFVTGTTPAVTVESTDLTVNNMGWSQKRPWLQTGYTYNITLPKGLVITEYELTTLEGGGFNGTFTYTTADGTATSPAQTASEQTVSAKGLSTNTISLVVGDGTDGTKGIMMTKLVIKYKEVPVEEETPSEITYTLNKANGDLYHKNGSANQTWNNIWKSTSEPQLLFGCGDPNNMNWYDSNIQMMTGTSNRSTYTLTAPEGYMIAEYSFTFTNNNHSNGLGLTMDDGAVYTTSTNEQTVSAKNVQASTVSFVLDGANGNGVVLKNFTVKVKKDVVEAPKVSTNEKQYWYYITSASTKDYCAGKVIYYDSNTGKLRFGDKTFSASHIWSFWEQDGKLAIKNYNGEYFGTAGSGTGGSTSFGVVSEPNYIYNVNEAYGFYVIKDNAVELHAQNDNKVIVRWGAEAGGASLWRFNELDVTNANAAIGSTRVQQGKVTTGIGNTNQPTLRSTIRIGGLQGKVTFQGVKGRFEGTNAADVTNVKAYFATNSRELFIDDEQKMTWREQNGAQFGATVQLANDGTFTITGSKDMIPGDYYLWITYDIAQTAKEGNLVDAVITGYTVDGKEVVENNGNPKHSVTVFLSEGAVLMPMDKGSLYYRIPSITATVDGKRLVTLTDDRKAHNSDLPSHCYLVAQYSEDNGKTWSNPVTVAGTAETGGNYGHGDASIVTDRNTGNIIGIMTSAGTYGHGFFAGTAAEPPRWKTITSKDGGLTWETPVDHTNDLFGANCANEKTNTWKSGFSGSGAALQKRDGTLVSSFVNRAEDNSQNFHFFMSKDGGKSWYVSGTSGTKSADEPKTLERNNGDLAISVRASGYNYYNYTSDNGETWHNASQTRFNSGISGNACDGEYMVWCSTLEGNPWDIAFQTIPNSGSRENVSIALSTDEGATFGTPKTICPSGSAYSATVVLPDGTVGCYYEENGLFGGYTMRFVRFSLDWASNGLYKFTEEAPFKPIKSVEPAAVESTIGESGIGTFYANDPVNVPEGVKAYAATEEPDMTEGVLTMTEVEGIIPAHTGVVLRAAKGDYSFTQASTNGTVVNGNMLVGYAGPAEYKEVSLPENASVYVLAVEDNVAGFYKKDQNFNVYNNKAYLQVPGVSGARAIYFDFGGETGILETENGEVKTENCYDLSGRRVQKAQKGIYIVNGELRVVK
ncbi:MAG: exo-alpha-sialidase [Bacteroidaceae bacterium]|nr:exo-alpha-sialidase [Bacteroidaceae bacterium]